jgi:hypothetical protein
MICLVGCLFYVTIFQSYRGSDVMRWGWNRKSKPRLLPTLRMLNLPHQIDMVWEQLAFEKAVSLHSGEIECSKAS